MRCATRCSGESFDYEAVTRERDGRAHEGTVTGKAGRAKQLSRRRATLAIGILLVVVLIPMAANTVATYLVDLWSQRVQATADQWIAQQPGASIQSVTVVSKNVYANVQTPAGLPPTDELVASLDGQIPNGIPVFVTTTVGQQMDAGVVGQPTASGSS